MAIEDRPLNEFELDCIMLSQERFISRKYPTYLKLLKQKELLRATLHEICSEAAIGANFLLNELLDVEYQVGWWDGKAFSDVQKERS